MFVMFPLKQENGQIIRTKRWLYEALGSLLRERPFTDITVGQLCKRADVSRAVFYNHYANKEELVREVFTRIMTVYWEKLQHHVALYGTISSLEVYALLCRELMRSRGFIRQLPSNNFAHLLTEFFIHQHDPFFRLTAGKPPPTLPAYQKYFVPYHSTAMSDLIFRWLCAPDPDPPEEMAQVIQGLLLASDAERFLGHFPPSPADPIRPGS